MNVVEKRIAPAIRQAASDDVDVLCQFDHIARFDERRRAFIGRAVADGHCLVAEVGGRVVGYVVLEYSFYEQGFVSLLYVHPDHRRQGVGMALMQSVESACRTFRLFTSTNLSNLPMQSLLNKRGYILSGVIHHLDEDDPELVYVKYLKTNVQEERKGW